MVLTAPICLHIQKCLFHPRALSLRLHYTEPQCADELNIMASRSVAQVSFLL